MNKMKYILLELWTKSLTILQTALFVAIPYDDKTTNLSRNSNSTESSIYLPPNEPFKLAYIFFMQIFNSSLIECHIG